MATAWASTEGPAALTSEDLELLRRWAGVAGIALPDSEEALADEVMERWRAFKASGSHMYRCMEKLAFLRASVQDVPGSDEFIAYARTAHWVLDCGCGFGQDTREIILRGVPAASCIAADVVRSYWDAGCAVFGDAQASSSPLSKVTLCFGDWSAPLSFAAEDDIAGPWLGGGIDAVLCLRVLHVLSAQQQAFLLRRLALVTRANGRLLGTCAGAKGEASMEWIKTPDGSANRRLLSQSGLAKELAAAGWSNVVVGEAPMPHGLRPPPSSSATAASPGDPSAYLYFSAVRSSSVL